MVLATDFVQTHAFFLYDNSTTHNTTDSLCDQRVYRAVMGYDAKDLQNYFNLNQPAQQLAMLHNLPGNTGRTGDWHFDLTLPPGQATAEQRCLLWAKRQERQPNIDISSLEVKYCPCTLQQLLWDKRFWFGYFWGLSSSPNCATVLLSGSQNTLECCYDTGGALIVGTRGGSYKLYNPLFFYENYRQEDLLPYYDCCVNSQRCKLYYSHKPFDDCSLYKPIVPCK